MSNRFEAQVNGLRARDNLLSHIEDRRYPGATARGTQGLRDLAAKVRSCGDGLSDTEAQDVIRLMNYYRKA